MANITVVIREEISRLARKEIKNQTEALKKASAEHRKKIAEMKRQILELQRKVTFLDKQVLKNIQTKAGEDDTGRFRFSAKGLRSNRRRLGLSASDYGKLAGVTGQTVYMWERGTTRPREQQIETLAPLRRMGKKEAMTRLGELAKKKR